MNPETPALHVVAGVVRDPSGRVLVAQRAAGGDFAGYWEFPGGKVEPGETAAAALARELAEELGVRVVAAATLIRVPWTYPDKRIVLDALDVQGVVGDPQGRQGQGIRWVRPQDLVGLTMPPADRPIVAAIRLAREYAITPEPGNDPAAFLERLELLFGTGLGFVQLRARTLAPARLLELARQAAERALARNATLIVNAGDTDPALLPGAGVHLPAHAAARHHTRPVAPERWLGVSCHDERELEQALRIGADYAFLGPLQPTATHPGREPLGWSRFAALVTAVPIPVFGIGGLGPADLATLRAAGGFGVAATRAYWPPVGAISHSGAGA